MTLQLNLVNDPANCSVCVSHQDGYPEHQRKRPSLKHSIINYRIQPGRSLVRRKRISELPTNLALWPRKNALTKA